MFQSSLTCASQCNCTQQTRLRVACVVSILANSPKSVQRRPPDAQLVILPSFNPHVSILTLLYQQVQPLLTSHVSLLTHPNERVRIDQSIHRFHSSLTPKSECNYFASTGRFTSSLFQSSLTPESECNAIAKYNDEAQSAFRSSLSPKSACNARPKGTGTTYSEFQSSLIPTSQCNTPRQTRNAPSHVFQSSLTLTGECNQKEATFHKLWKVAT